MKSKETQQIRKYGEPAKSCGARRFPIFYDLMIQHGFHAARYLFSLQIVFIGFVLFSTITLVAGWISQNFAAYRKLSNGMKKEWRCRVTAFSHAIFAIVAMTYAALTFPYALEPEGKKLHFFCFACLTLLL